MHAVAVKLDFVQPLRPVRRLVDELGKLRSNPLRQCDSGHVNPAYLRAKSLSG